VSSGCTSKFTASRSWKRVCSICRYFLEELDLVAHPDLGHTDLLERQAQQLTERVIIRSA